MPNTIPYLDTADRYEDKYEVLTLHRECDRVCVVRLRGFDNTVFWKEINLHPLIRIGKSPRTRIIDAQIKAYQVAQRLRAKDARAAFEYQSSIR